MDLNELIKLLSGKDKQISELTDELKKQRILTEKLQAQLENLLRILYGKKSEKKKATNRIMILLTMMKATTPSQKIAQAEITVVTLLEKSYLII